MYYIDAIKLGWVYNWVKEIQIRAVDLAVVTTVSYPFWGVSYMAWYMYNEELVANSLRARGAHCKVDTWMTGAADVHAYWPKTGTTWRIQVKSTKIRGKTPAWPNTEELRRLKMTATKNRETPVVALVYRDYRIEFYSARSERQLRPPDTRMIT